MAECTLSDCQASCAIVLHVAYVPSTLLGVFWLWYSSGTPLVLLRYSSLFCSSRKHRRRHHLLCVHFLFNLILYSLPLLADSGRLNAECESVKEFAQGLSLGRTVHTGRATCLIELIQVAKHTVAALAFYIRRLVCAEALEAAIKM